MSIIAAILIAQAAATSAPLSNGLRSGMTPEEVSQQLTTLPDVSSAKPTGSRKRPNVAVKYRNEWSDLDGFKFHFGFDFEDGKLFWVDLLGQPLCSNAAERLADKLTLKFQSLYGEADGGGVYHRSGVDVYVMKIIDDLSPPSDIDGESTSAKLRAIDYKYKVLAAERKCGSGASLTMLTIRFKANPKLAPVAFSPEEMARIKAASEKAQAEARQKAASDAERLKLN